MANIVIAKKDMAGGVLVGKGWLIAPRWARLVGDDPRFVNDETAKAAFRDLAVGPAESTGTLDHVEWLMTCDAVTPGYRRSRVLVEDQQSGDLLRVYRSEDGLLLQVSERVCQLMGHPEILYRLVNVPHVARCPAGLIADCTDQLPPWAEELVG